MKRLIILLTAFSVSVHSFSRPRLIGSEIEENETKQEESACLDGITRDNIISYLNHAEYDESPIMTQQSRRNPPKKRRVSSSKKVSREKTSKRNRARNVSRNPRSDRSSKRTPKKRHSDLDMGIGLMADAIGGYSNFMWDEGSPVAGFGFGAGLTGQFHLNETDYAPDGYFAELGVNYARKGSGAYPIDYVNTNVLPLGYSFNHLFGDFSLFVKAGGYVAYPFSKIKTNSQSFDTNLDYGAIGSVGVSYEKFSVSVSYEHGFADVCDANVSLKNQNIFLTLSYRLF